MIIKAKQKLFLLLMFCNLIYKTESEDIHTSDLAKGRGFDNPCCYYPCENRGVCMPNNHEYICDCKGLKYFGKNCHRATWNQWLKHMLTPSLEDGLSYLRSWPVLWFLVNNIAFLQDIIMKYIYMSSHELVMTPSTCNPVYDYITMDSYFNHSYYARDLPPIPPVCPTAMGTQGKIELPPVEKVIEKVLIRDKFHVNMQGKNLLYAAYAQHFIHQFLKMDTEKGFGITWGNHGVDASQIYGKDKGTRTALRSFKDGKLKMQVINSEEYPPFLDALPDLYDTYPHSTSIEIMGNDKQRKQEDFDQGWAIGDPFINKNPWLVVTAIIWLREHNRICTILQREHPSWGDERLYQTARLIITGEMIKITLEEYLPQLGQYNFAFKYKPELLHHTEFQYSNCIHLEFNFMHYWHALEPQNFQFQSKMHNMTRFYDSNSMVLTDNGLDVIVDLMVNTAAGEIGYKNYPNSSFCAIFKMLSWSREMRMQSFNNYRKAFGMQPYHSFLEMTGNPEIALILKELYQDVNAVELFIGMVTEKKQRSLLGQTGVVMMMSWSIKLLMSHAIGSPGWWRPSTFGGKLGMNIIKETSLKSLICNNLKNKCKNMDISFKIPYMSLQDFLKQIYDQEVNKFVPRKKCGLRLYSKLR